MSRIRIRNFGPIKGGCQDDDGWIDIKKATVFIGNQGSGKSTVAKVISTLTWLEKALNRGDIDSGKISLALFQDLYKYHRVYSYFGEDTKIEYIGNRYSIFFDKKTKFPIIKEISGKSYKVPKIMYVPAERNFLSTISDAYNIKGLPESLFTFAEELRKAQQKSEGKQIKLPINELFYEYHELDEISYLLNENHFINLLEASSGFQSFVPLFLVSRNLSQLILEKEEKIKKTLTVNQSVRLLNELISVVEDKTLTEKEIKQKTKQVKDKFYNKCFINIVEEPEQNLFPTSQWDLLKSLLEFNNMSNSNKLLMTTHSPYIIMYLSIAIQAGYLKTKIKDKILLKKLYDIVPQKSIISGSDVAVYQFDEKNGEIRKLPDYNGIPSDENYLNLSLSEGNELFDKLLELEQEI